MSVVFLLLDFLLYELFILSLNKAASNTEGGYGNTLCISLSSAKSPVPGTKPAPSQSLE